MTVGMVSCVLLCWRGGFCGFWLIWNLLLILRNFLFPAGVGLPPGVLLCVRVRRPRAFGFYGSGLLLFFLSFLGVWFLVFLVCAVKQLRIMTDFILILKPGSVFCKTLKN